MRQTTYGEIHKKTEVKDRKAIDEFIEKTSLDYKKFASTDGCLYENKSIISDSSLNYLNAFDDKDIHQILKMLIRKEGLLVGGSSGTAVVAAIEAARNLKPNQNCLVILPDSIRNYLTKFVDDDWMDKNNFQKE